MPDEMRNEAMELCVTAVEKYPSNNEVKLLASKNTSLDLQHTLYIER